jgi:hypothetical protein
MTRIEGVAVADDERMLRIQESAGVASSSWRVERWRKGKANSL